MLAQSMCGRLGRVAPAGRCDVDRRRQRMQGADRDWPGADRDWQAADRDWQAADRDWQAADRDWQAADRDWQAADRDWQAADRDWQRMAGNGASVAGALRTGKNRLEIKDGADA
jgi:hypothetical protein